jgi:hypothetical protein
MKKIFSSIFFIVLIVDSASAQVEITSQENPDIPELKQMHHVIYSLWHKGYADKDTALLQSLYPDLEKQYRKLEKVEFPAEWPDREMHWKEGLTKMGNTLDSYKKAVNEKSKRDLLTSARQMHDDFERLVRIVNPPIPEIDDFHKILYHVYHDYLPAKDWEKVKESIPQFQAKMEGINNISPPKWMSDNEKQFSEARQNLNRAVENLALFKKSKDEKKLKQAIEELHEAYVNLESTLE